MATILVVDDEPAIITVISDWLKLHQHTVLVTSNSLEVIRLVEAESPDLILLDVMMPEISGIDICRQLRSNKTTNDIPIILISGCDPITGRMDGLKAGANDFITKPFSLQDLSRRINNFLRPTSSSLHHGEHLLQETVETILSVLPCSLAWLLTVDKVADKLVSRAVAASPGKHAANRFLSTLGAGGSHYQISLKDTVTPGESVPDKSLLRRVLYGAAEFNLPISELRNRGDERIFRACEQLNLYFVTIVPLHLEGQAIGVMLVGSFEPHDVETTRGQQLLAAGVSQAATAVENARLMRRIAEYESDSSQERSFSQVVLDIMGDGLLLFDEHHKIIFANRRLALMTGYDMRILTGLSLEDLCHPEHRHRLQALLFDPDSAHTTPFEFDLVHADGGKLPVLAALASGTVTRKIGITERALVLTDLSEHKAREQVLMKQNQRLAALNRAFQAISSSMTLDEIISVILNEATAVLNARMASVLLRAPGASELFFHSAVGPGSEALRGQRVPLEGSISGFVALEGLPVLVDDAYKDKRFYPAIDRATGITTRSMAAVPLLLQDEVMGVVEIISEQSGVFGLDDLETLQGLARSAAIAIENASLFGETQRQVRELTLLLRASEAASSTLTIETVLQSIAHQLIEALNVGWCLIYSGVPGQESLVKLAQVAQVVRPASQARSIPTSGSPLMAEVIEGKSHLTATLSDVDNDLYLRRHMLDANYWSLAVLPIKRLDRVIGTVNLYHSLALSTFTPTDIDRCLTILAGWQSMLPNLADGEVGEHLSEVGESLLDASGAAWCEVYLLSPDHEGLNLTYEAGRSVWSLAQGEHAILDEHSLRRVALAERIAVAAPLDDARLSANDRVSLPQMAQGSMLVAPLIAHGEAVGLVQLIDIDPRRVFSEQELSLAQAMANVVGTALENGYLYTALTHRAAQLEAAYNDLRDADRLTDEMIQNISHELRTPLTPIVGYIDMLLAGDLGALAEDQRRAMEVVHNHARLLSQMIESIVTVQTPSEPAQFRKLVDLGDIAASAIEAADSSAKRSGITLTLDVPDASARIYADEKQLLQVFDCLISNAIKFSPNGGEVKFRLRDIGQSVKVDVVDQGIGIPVEEHAKIWRRFYQVDGSTTRAFNGLGLGLSIVKQVIERHGGQVLLRSEPGQGSTFILILPKGEPILVSEPDATIALSG